MLYNQCMETFKTLTVKSGLTKQALQNRVRLLKIKKKYEINEEDRLERVFDDKDAEAILNYERKKPGRKRKDK